MLSFYQVVLIYQGFERRVARRENCTGHITSIDRYNYRHFLLLAIIGIATGVVLFKSDHYIWALICIAGGIAVIIGLLIGAFGSGEESTYHNEECPYCANGDTDGNHCYSCDEDF